MTLFDRLLRAWTGEDAWNCSINGDDAWSNRDPDGAPMPAATLVAFVDRPRPTIVLTRRAEALSTHGGQVALPGGRIDDGESPVEAALREAEEEIGLTRGVPSVVGCGDIYLTGTNFAVTPVVAVIPAGLVWTLDDREVASVFEVPADTVFSPENQLAKLGLWQGAMRRYWEIVGHDEIIWGATAGMLVNLGRRLGLDRDPKLLNDRVGG